MTVWIVGQWESGGHPESVAAWQFQGVFAAEDEAIAACRDSCYFIAPATMGETLPHDRTKWPGLRYPIP